MSTTKKSKNTTLSKQLITILIIAAFALSSVPPPYRGTKYWKCPSGGFFDLQSYSCLSCESPCKECGGSPTNCLTCPEGSSILQIESSSGEISQTCLCPKGKRFDSETSSCVICPENCARCTKEKCLLCLNGEDYPSTPVDAICPELTKTCGDGEFYDEAAQACMSCDMGSGCQECFGDSSERKYCTQCQPERILSQDENSGSNWNLSCIKKCPLGKFDLNWTGDLADPATTATQQCEWCNPECEICTQYGICWKCFEGFELTLDGKCMKARRITESGWCPRGQFYSQETKKCEICLEGCAVCFDENSCEICLNGFVASEEKCKKFTPNCGTGEMRDRYNILLCKEHSTAIDGYDYKKCPFGYHISSGGCASDETVGYTVPQISSSKTLDISPPEGCEMGQRKLKDSQCVNCGINCAQCSETECTVCRPGYIKNSEEPNKCFLEEISTVCFTGKYPGWEGNKNYCFDCPLGCKTCLGDGKCVNCYPYHILNGEKTFCFFHSNEDNTTCFFHSSGEKTYCLFHSSSLNGNYYPEPYADDQKLCKTKMYFSETSNSCDYCEGKISTKCQDCTSGDFCDRCQSGYMYEVSLQGCNFLGGTLGDGTCREGYYLDSGSCKACPPNCKKCHSNDWNSWCLECFEGYAFGLNDSCTKMGADADFLEDLTYLFASKKMFYSLPDNTGNCEAGTFIHPVGGEKFCYPCLEICSTCSNSITCDSCPLGFQHNEKTKLCEFPTPSKDFPAYQNEDSFSQIDKNCGVGKVYSSEKNKCLKCLANCAVCSVDSHRENCDVCHPGFFFNKEVYRCYQYGFCGDIKFKCLLKEENDYCGQGMVFQKNSEGKGICRKCQNYCEKCVDQNICLTCSEGFYLVEGECIQVEKVEITKVGDSEYDLCPINMAYQLIDYQVNAILKCVDGATLGHYGNNCWRFSSVKAEYTKPGISTIQVKIRNSCMKCSYDSDPYFDPRTGERKCLDYDFEVDFKKFVNKVFGQDHSKIFMYKGIAKAATGYHFDSSTKITTLCPLGCAICSKDGVCEECFDNFSLEKNSENVAYCKWTLPLYPITEICRERTTLEIYNANGFFSDGSAYLSFLGVRCTSCPENCYSCSSKDTCDLCSSGYSKDENGICQQNEGGSEIPIVDQCPEGSILGYRKEVSSNTFTYSETQLDEYQKYCQICGANQGIEEVEPYCSKCSWNEPETCLECFPGMEKTDQGKCQEPGSGTQEQCSDGFYSSKGECKSCGRYCKGCLDEKNCYECWPGEECTLVNSEIPEGKYFEENEGTLKNCGENCKTCLLFENTCTSCHSDSNMFLKKISTYDYQCVCNPGFYVFDPNLCINCPKNCETCESSSTCTKCFEGFTKNGDGVCEDTNCSEGQYFSGTSCINCPDSCKDCGTGEECSSCPEGTELLNKKCSPKCERNEYLNLEGTACVTCPFGCQTCSEAEGCSTCMSDGGFELVLSAFYSKSLEKMIKICSNLVCLNGFRGVIPKISNPNTINDFEVTCEYCPDECTSCDPDGCSKCKEGYINLRKKCYKNCENSGQFLDFRKFPFECEDCPGYCSKCTTDAYCLECQEGYDFGILIGEENQCFNCKENEFRNSLGECETCPLTCLSCKSKTECTSCISGLVLLSNNLCYEDCGEGKYRDLTQGSTPCLNCSENCKSCENSSKCNICSNEYVLQGDICSCPTDAGYYLLNNICRKCDKTCLTCESENMCLSCPEGQKVQPNGVCAEEEEKVEGVCKKGYFDNRKGNCTKCHWKCSSCYGPGKAHCDECLFENYVLFLGECTCPKKKYSIEEGGECTQDCHETCGFCSGPLETQCLSCEENGSIPDNEGKCVSCVKNPELEVCVGLTEEISVDDEDDEDIIDMDGILEGEGRFKEESLKPGVPVRERRNSIKFFMRFPGLENFEEKLTSEILEGIFGYEIEGFKYGEDFSVELTYNPRRKKILIEIICKKNINSILIIATKDYSAFLSHEIPEEEKVWDGNYRRRILEEFNGVILKEQTIKKEVKVEIPSEKTENLFTLFGKITRIIMFILLVCGLLFTIYGLIKQEPGFEIFHFNTMLVISTLTKFPLINIDYGTYLSLFMDEIYKFDIFFIWKFIQEAELRGLIGGKLDEYRVPVLVLNTISLKLALYLISFILSGGIKFLLKKKDEKLKNKIIGKFERIHFWLLGFCLGDILFYGVLEILNHSPYKAGNSLGSVISYALSLLTIIFLFFDIKFFVTKIFGEEKKIEGIYQKFGVDGLKQSKSGSPKLLNFEILVKVVLIQIIIAVLHKSEKILSLIVLVISFAFLIGFSIITASKKPFKSCWKFSSNFLLQLFFFLISLGIFLITLNQDKEQHGTTTSDGSQIGVLIMILCVLVLELTRQVTGILRLSGKRKEIEEVKGVSDIFNIFQSNKENGEDEKKSKNMNHRRTPSLEDSPNSKNKSGLLKKKVKIFF